jgi:hypothetical protein
MTKRGFTVYIDICQILVHLIHDLIFWKQIRVEMLHDIFTATIGALAAPHAADPLASLTQSHKDIEISSYYQTTRPRHASIVFVAHASE